MALILHLLKAHLACPVLDILTAPLLTYLILYPMFLQHPPTKIIEELVQ